MITCQSRIPVPENHAIQLTQLALELETLTITVDFCVFELTAFDFGHQWQETKLSSDTAACSVVRREFNSRSTAQNEIWVNKGYPTKENYKTHPLPSRFTFSFTNNDSPHHSRNPTKYGPTTVLLGIIIPLRI